MIAFTPFGPVTASPLFTAASLKGIGASSSVWQIVEQFLQLSEGVAERIAEGPGGLLLLVGVPGRENTGALYLYQKSSHVFFSLDFAAQDSFSSMSFDAIVQMYSLDKLIATPTEVTSREAGRRRRRQRHRGRREDDRASVPANPQQHAKTA